jgi:hypothetical protein
MGYVDKPKVYRVVFDSPDDDQHGFEARMRGVSSGQALDLMGLQDVDETDAATVAGIFQALADAIVTWNLEDSDGNPVRPSLEAVKARDFSRNMALFGLWIEAVIGVSGPLERPSSDGGRALLASIPMEPLSPSRAS